MIWIKWGLLLLGLGSFVAALGRLAWDYRRLHGEERTPWRLSRGLALVPVALFAFVLYRSIVIVPNGMAAVRVSQSSGTRPGALFPGVHFIRPLVEDIALYDVRERMLTTSGSETTPPEKGATAPARLDAQSKEGLSVGLAVSVRYRLEPKRLDHIHASLPAPVERELVPPVVSSAFRQVLPNYLVREIFATRREEVRRKAEELITVKLAEDGIVVKEVMLRDIVLPPEYARGLEGLLLKEQESERMAFDVEIKAKQVKTAELEAEAQKTREIKKAEGEAHVRVLRAKAEADAMQHTLPLKEKEVMQSKLEAEARKEATIKNAEAAAAAKVIDAEAEKKRQLLMADADANRIRVLASADAERMGQEAVVLQQNPLLIQKIVAERLSDKLQIMMVPMDGKNFFATDVLQSAFMGGGASRAAAERTEDDKRRVARR